MVGVIPSHPLWRTTETAAYLGRPVGTLRQWRHKGIGPPCFKVEGLVMYRKSAVEAWLAEQEKAERCAAERAQAEPLRIEDLFECPICFAVMRLGRRSVHAEWHGSRPVSGRASC